MDEKKFRESVSLRYLFHQRFYRHLIYVYLFFSNAETVLFIHVKWVGGSWPGALTLRVLRRCHVHRPQDPQGSQGRGYLLQVKIIFSKEAYSKSYYVCEIVFKPK